MVVEFWLIVAVATQIGALSAIAATLLTAIIGMALVKRQGVSTLARAREKAESGESPAREVVEGLALLVAGIMLFLPGFISDGLGVLLLIPGLRSALAGNMVRPLVNSRFGRTQFQHRETQFRSQNSQSHPGRDREVGETFEGEYKRTDDSNSDNDKKNQNFLP